MKRVIEAYTGTKTYMFPNGDIATPEAIKAQFPAVDTFPHMIETDEAGQVCFAVQNLAAMKSFYNIPVETGAEDAMQIIEDILNNPPEPEIPITPEERIAAALELNNLLNM